MTASFTPRDAAGLREQLAGRVLLPGQDECDAARQVWNASHDHRPALITQPLSVADVQAAVRFARDRELPVSVRGGGHDHAGYAAADGGLGPASAEELQRAACAVMAFGFAEVTTIDQVLGRIPVAASASAPARRIRSERIVRSGFTLPG